MHFLKLRRLRCHQSRVKHRGYWVLRGYQGCDFALQL